MNLRSFLMRHPRPATIRVLTLDGEAKTISVDPKMPWVQVAGYIASLDWETLECLDAEGHVLRGTASTDLDEGEDEQVQLSTAYAPTLAARMKAPEDPQSAQLVLFAQLLADAYRHTTDVAFSRMIDLFEQVNKRYETTEKALDRVHKTVERLTEKHIERATSEQDDFSLNDLAQAFAGGQANGQQQAPNQNHGAPSMRREPPPPGHHPHNGRGHA